MAAGLPEWSRPLPAALVRGCHDRHFLLINAIVSITTAIIAGGAEKRPGKEQALRGFEVGEERSADRGKPAIVIMGEDEAGRLALCNRGIRECDRTCVRPGLGRLTIGDFLRVEQEVRRWRKPGAALHEAFGDREMDLFAGRAATEHIWTNVGHIISVPGLRSGGWRGHHPKEAGGARAEGQRGKIPPDLDSGFEGIAVVLGADPFRQPANAGNGWS